MNEQDLPLQGIVEMPLLDLPCPQPHGVTGSQTQMVEVDHVVALALADQQKQVKAQPLGSEQRSRRALAQIAK